jgi:Raf kinase inhibitor-like YbhB/YbcL family protein
MLTIKSPAFSNGTKIPIKFTQYGDSISPALEWTCNDSSVREFALLCTDPDAPTDKPVVHWLIYGIDAGARSLPENVPNEKILNEPLWACQGKNTKGKYGYMGPKPPKADRAHRYFFKLFGLDEPLGAAPGLTKEEFLEKARNHIIAEAEMIGLYQYEGVDLSPGLVSKVGEFFQELTRR